MTKIAWATDIHLDFLTEQQVIAFAESIRRQSPTAVIITGDISVASGIVLHLSILERVLQIPIYFVLGNHDYYGDRIATVRAQMKELANMSGFLKYLPTIPYVGLTPATALVGHDGWYDALYGNPLKSRYIMLDWSKIGDYVEASAIVSNTPMMNNIIPKSRELAMEAVQHVHDGIKAATRYHKNIIVATHFPPFAEAHMFKGRVGSSEAQPWYTSKMMGDMLLSASRAFPDVQFTVLAGHTHGQFTGQITKNLICHVGHSEYGNPTIADILNIG